MTRSDSALSEDAGLNSHAPEPTLVVDLSTGDQRLVAVSNAAAAAASNGKCRVYVVTRPLPGSRSAADADASFAALAEEVEADESLAQHVKAGRQWVGKRFYADERSLSALRLAAGLSQKELAERCQLEQPHVSRYESGRHEPSLETAVRLAGALGVSLDEFAQAWSVTRAGVATRGAS